MESGVVIPTKRAYSSSTSIIRYQKKVTERKDVKNNKNQENHKAEENDTKLGTVRNQENNGVLKRNDKYLNKS